MDVPRELLELRREECLRLLAGGVIGRVVFTVAALPAAHPVTYLLDDEEVVFSTAGGGKLAAATLHRVVAFEVDEIDTATRTGWSVLGVGEAYAVIDPRRLADLTPRLPTPWAAQRVGHTVAVPLQRLTGRRLVAPEKGEAQGGVQDDVGAGLLAGSVVDLRPGVRPSGRRPG